MFILDTTVFINFSLGGALEILMRELPGQLAVGPAVAERELQVWPRRSDRPGEKYDLQPWFESGALEKVVLTDAEATMSGQVRADLVLGEGEAEALAIALSRRWILATDDGRARRKVVTAFSSVVMTGTVGLLEDLVEAGAIDAAACDTIALRIWKRGGTPRGRVNYPRISPTVPDSPDIPEFPR